jgi:hypothetical protein
MHTLALAIVLPLLFATGARAAEAASDPQPCNIDQTPELKDADYTFEVRIVRAPWPARLSAALAPCLRSIRASPATFNSLTSGSAMQASYMT